MSQTKYVTTTPAIDRLMARMSYVDVNAGVPVVTIAVYAWLYGRAG